jgi:ferredoxin
MNEVRVYIDPKTCIDCGACISVCPVHAIVEEFDLAEGEQHWLRINEEAALRYPVVREKLLPLASAGAKRSSLGF